MKLIHVRHFWGLNGTLESNIDLAKADGYAAIETGIGLGEPAKVKDLLRATEMKFVAAIFTGGATVDEHLASFRRDVAAAAKFEPLLISVHSGRDSFTFAESVRFYREVVKIEKDLPVKVAHETHRGRVFFNPWITRDVLAEVPELQLCCDLSHWVCVCERLLDDVGPIIDLAAKHCLHIHARVGYEEGPQVPDPSASEYRRQLETHEGWWRKMLAARAAAGHQATTITPEFGPPGYLHTLPHTNVPVADLRTVCNWMKKRLSETLAT